MSDIVKETTEMTSASVATSTGGGFVNGGPGTITRAPGSKKKKSKAKKKA